jgi:superfamily II DNA/RNA helicase
MVPEPTPIQDQVIPYLLDGYDVIGMADTGTGKTVAFLIPLVNKVVNQKKEKVLIIVPTRELAIQINEELRMLLKKTALYSVTCIGGIVINRQIKYLKRNPNFVIGTPGRLKDLEGRRKIFFNDYSSIVLDEVDRMLDMGFLPDVKHIVSRLPRERQSLFFSATLPEKLKGVTHEFLNNPKTVAIKSGETSNNVKQDIIKINGRKKIDLLHELLIQKEFNKVLLFGKTKLGIERLLKDLQRRGFRAASIHGNKKQNQRQRALDQFKGNRIQILLATDIASRGLDIDDVSHVINYDLPESYEDYIHRIGRTGRINKKGIALTFVE